MLVSHQPRSPDRYNSFVWYHSRSWGIQQSQLGDINLFARICWSVLLHILFDAAYDIPGVIIIYAKLSDIFGRKSFLLLALLTFVIFSGACGAAQTIDELYVNPAEEIPVF